LTRYQLPRKQADANRPAKEASLECVCGCRHCSMQSG